METRAQRPRFWVAIQPTIVKLYKVAGLVALTAILVGLLGFIVVNVFYFFDHTWVRPVVLSSSHQKVVDASTQHADAKLRESQLATEKLDVVAQLAEIERTAVAQDKFITDIGTQADTPRTPEQWLVRRELENAKLEKENAIGRRASLHQRLESLKLRMDEQNKLVERLGRSPYLKALEGDIVLAFVPYQNLGNLKEGTKLYSCAWGLVACSGAGKITRILPGEVTDIHPHDETVQRGQMVEIDVSDSDAGKTVLFAGGKPLWLF